MFFAAAKTHAQTVVANFAVADFALAAGVCSFPLSARLKLEPLMRKAIGGGRTPCFTKFIPAVLQTASKSR
jgi:hypothetical protein